MGETITIDGRFCGPPGAGNGGYIAGRLAALLGNETAQVTLRRPTPLDRMLRVEREAASLRLSDGDTLLAEAAGASLDLAVPPAPSFAAAEASARGYVGFSGDGPSNCFVCGPSRPPGEGLRIFAGPLDDVGRVAAPWVPDASLDDGAGRVASPYLWSALDCPGAFALKGGTHRPMLLGRITAACAGSVAVGERCVVLAWPIGRDGRKKLAGSAVFGADGRLCAAAQAVWFTVERT